MELFLLKLLFFLRPIMMMQIFHYQFKGFNIFEIFAIFCFILLYLLLIKRTLLKKLKIELIDISILVTIVWFIFVFIVHYKNSSIYFLAQLIIPLFTFFVIKNIVENTEQYIELIGYYIIGASIPIIYSVYLIMLRKSISNFTYLQHIVRYKGAYLNPHNFAHSMTLFLILLIILRKICDNISEFNSMFCFKSIFLKIFSLFLAILSLFCLYKSHVRTAYTGLVTFLFLYFYWYNRKFLYLFLFLIIILIIKDPQFLIKEFYDVFMVFEHKCSTDYLGSGRLFIWKLALNYFFNQDLSNIFSGLGINNYIFSKYIANSHNDVLDILIETGFVGLFLYFFIQYLYLKKIFTISGPEKKAILSFFIAVWIMNFISNSYISRFAFSQLFYTIMCYPYIKEKEKLHD